MGNENNTPPLYNNNINKKRREWAMACKTTWKQTIHQEPAYAERRAQSCSARSTHGPAHQMTGLEVSNVTNNVTWANMALGNE
jgi:hypothetical protein